MKTVNGGIGVTPAMANMLALEKDPASEVQAAKAGYGNRVLATALAHLKELRVGDRLYRDVSVGSVPISLGRCGNLGLALFSHNLVIFDLKNRRMWLLPKAGGG